jgi:transposase InsO family protein
MPWKTISAMSEKKLFVSLARVPGASKSALCTRFGISRPTGDKLLQRYADEGDAGLCPRSRRPLHSPGQTDAIVTEQIVALRRKHPAWGGRKIGRVLRNKRVASVPAVSTINEILRRNGLIDPQEAGNHHAWMRFEHEAPNDMWQMDFKGHFALADGVTRCHPLTVLDDHSRFSLAIHACAQESMDVVRHALIRVFRQYGMPLCILSDNGPPWGTPGVLHGYTQLNAWLIQLGVRITHGKPYHPQTQGKDERFHRTFKAEVLRDHHFRTHEESQDGFDTWREEYNCERPHEALGLDTPASRYMISPRAYPEHMPKIEYGPTDIVRIVQAKGEISFKGTIYTISQAFQRNPVALRPTTTDGVYDVYFCHQCLRQIDLRTNQLHKPL